MAYKENKFSMKKIAVIPQQFLVKKEVEKSVMTEIKRF